MICGFIADWLLKQSARVNLIEIVREWRKDRHTERHMYREKLRSSGVGSMETESDYYQELSREAGFLHPHKETRCMCIGQQRQAYLRLVKAVSREALSSVRKHLVYIFYAHYKHLYKDPRGWLFIPLSLTLGVWLCYTHVANAASSTHSPRTSLTQGFLCLQSWHSISISIELSLSMVVVVFILWL